VGTSGPILTYMGQAEFRGHFRLTSVGSDPQNGSNVCVAM
jgi:hypothetical protein